MQQTEENVTAPDVRKVEKFAGQVINDLSAGMSGVLTQVGHELVLYKAMHRLGPTNAEQLSEKTNTFKR